MSTKPHTLGDNLRILQQGFNPSRAKEEPTFYGSLPLASSHYEPLHLLSRIQAYHFYLNHPQETMRAFRYFAEACLDMFDVTWDNYEYNDVLHAHHVARPQGHVYWAHLEGEVAQYVLNNNLKDEFDSHHAMASRLSQVTNVYYHNPSSSDAVEAFYQNAACAIRFLAALSPEEEQALCTPSTLQYSDLSYAQKIFLGYIFNGPHFYCGPSEDFHNEIIFYCTNPFLDYSLGSLTSNYGSEIAFKLEAYRDEFIPYLENALHSDNSLSDLIAFDILESSFNQTLRESLRHFSTSFELPADNEEAVLFSFRVPLHSLEKYIYYPSR